MKIVWGVLVVAGGVWLAGWDPDWLMLGIWAGIAVIVVAMGEYQHRQYLRRPRR